MAVRYRLESASPADYASAVRTMATAKSKTLFHEPAWIEYLSDTGKGEPRYLAIVGDDGTTRGFLPYLRVRVGPLRVMGSPLPGWTTNHLGPLFSEPFDHGAFVDALRRHVRANRYLYLEVGNPALSRPALEAGGFRENAGVTTLVRLGPEEDMWRAVRGTARNRVKKAVAAGLEFEVTRDRSMVPEYHAMIVRRYAEQGMEFPFGVERLEALWDRLHGEGLLIAARVLHEGRTAASGLFPHDGRCVYYFGGASRPETLALCPNEFLHWNVMKAAAGRGIAMYDMCGASRFKRKFGGDEVPFSSWSYSPVPGLFAVRRALYSLHWKWLRIRRRVSSAFEE